jgi:hypothetical protein
MGERSVAGTLHLPAIDLEESPDHMGKRSAARTLHLPTIDLEESPEEVLVWLDPKEGIVDDHEAR